MNAVMQDQQNIFETVIRDALRDTAARLAPRIYVRRHTLTEQSFHKMLSPEGHTPRPPISTFLAGAHPVVDITSRFRLTPNWTPTDENESVELDFDYYASIPCNKQSQIEFSFTEPVVYGDESVFYAVSDRGFLWAHGFMCTFSGTFDQPSNHKIVTVWQS